VGARVHYRRTFGACVSFRTRSTSVLKGGRLAGITFVDIWSKAGFARLYD
jgi:hypothetical protein